MRENRTSGLKSGMWKRSKVRPVRHRQSKESANGYANLNHRATSRLHRNSVPGIQAGCGRTARPACLPAGRFEERDVETEHGLASETPATERVGQRICQPKPPRHISTPPELAFQTQVNVPTESSDTETVDWDIDDARAECAWPQGSTRFPAKAPERATVGSWLVCRQEMES